MKQIKRVLMVLLAAALFVLAPAATAHAVSSRYHPPAVTFLVMNAPRDLRLTIKLIKNGEPINVEINKERRVWESYFRLYRDAVWQIDGWYGNQYDLKDATITMESGGVRKTLPVPSDQLSEHKLNDYLCMRYGSDKMTVGLPSWRAPLLVGMRVAIGLLVEGLFFYYYGYRQKVSWRIILIVNLITGLILNLFVNGWINVDSNYYVMYAVGLLIMASAEIVAMLILLEEQDRDRCINCVLYGNLAGALVHIGLITLLPV